MGSYKTFGSIDRQQEIENILPVPIAKEQGNKLSLCFGEKELAWEDLKKLETKRNNIQEYDSGAHHSGYSSVLFQINGTVIQSIFLDPLFWITVAIFVGLVLLDQRKTEHIVIEDSIMDAFNFFSAFVLTAFVRDCQRDYHIAYDDAMIVKDKIMEMAALAQSVLPEKEASQIVRRMNAAHLVGYTCLANTYNRKNFFEPFNAEIQVLNSSELSRIDKIDSKMEKGSKACFEIVSWAMKDIQACRKAGHIDSRTALTLQSTLLGFRSSMSKVFNDQAFPVVTFFYFHLVSLICIMYLPLYAWNQASKSNVKELNYTHLLRFLAVIVQCIFVIGMRMLGIKLLAPFEDDLENLSVMTFVRTGWEASNDILDSKICEEDDFPHA